LARETEVLRENLPQCCFVQSKPHMFYPGTNLGHLGGKPAINRLIYGTATVFGEALEFYTKGLGFSALPLLSIL
jgi:hypothetical protein